ncbi:MAG: hypothetical protein AAB669_00295 [Patescibacteria group bacterium]
MRYIIGTIVTLLLLCASAAARKLNFSVETFDMQTDRLEFRHYPGGRTAKWVETENDATVARNACFFGKKSIDGAKVPYQVDLYIKHRQVIIPARPKRPVLAVYLDNTVKIFADYQTMLPWGMPNWAIGGMRSPPRPGDSHWRQFVAVKNHYYFRVVVKGSADTCAWLAHKWGFESIIHLDGGSSISPGMVVPSHLLVFAKGVAKPK